MQTRYELTLAIDQQREEIARLKQELAFYSQQQQQGQSPQLHQQPLQHVHETESQPEKHIDPQPDLEFRFPYTPLVEEHLLTHFEEQEFIAYNSF